MRWLPAGSKWQFFGTPKESLGEQFQEQKDGVSLQLFAAGGLFGHSLD
jgi:hypothetical protein